MSSVCRRSSRREGTPGARSRARPGAGRESDRLGLHVTKRTVVEVRDPEGVPLTVASPEHAQPRVRPRIVRSLCTGRVLVLETADTGRIEAADGEMVDFSARPSRTELNRLRDRSAIVFQHYNLFPHKTILENIIEGPVVVQRRSRAVAVAEARELLGRAGLGAKESSHPSSLSGGQQQRVGIVRALALRPELLLFDEPTSALDPELVGEILSLMRDLAQDGWTMVVVTHELQFAREVAHHVAFIDEGEIVEHGPPAQLLRQPEHERTRQFVHRLLHPL
ncbi:MAG: amino acid ABC transporter ATP-binding protein [Actinomycetales bacterium]|nr:amino acid ABC transporter ATP-binding protein [Actinomycetales bacterium]